MSGDLIAFISARLDEDEAAARAAFGTTGRWWRRKRQVYADSDELVPTGALLEGEPEIDDEEADIFIGTVVVYDEGSPSDDEFAHIARHDPARVLREVEAKRAILNAFRKVSAQMDEQISDPGAVAVMCALAVVVYRNAAVYSGHPDYRQEWAA